MPGQPATATAVTPRSQRHDSASGQDYAQKRRQPDRVYLQGEWRILVVTNMADETGAPGV